MSTKLDLLKQKRTHQEHLLRLFSETAKDAPNFEQNCRCIIYAKEKIKNLTLEIREEEKQKGK